MQDVIRSSSQTEARSDKMVRLRHISSCSSLSASRTSTFVPVCPLIYFHLSAGRLCCSDGTIRTRRRRGSVHCLQHKRPLSPQSRPATSRVQRSHGDNNAPPSSREENRGGRSVRTNQSHQGHKLGVSAVLKELSSHQHKDRKCSGLGAVVGELGASRLSPTSMMHLEVKVSQSVTKDSLAFSL